VGWPLLFYILPIRGLVDDIQEKYQSVKTRRPYFIVGVLPVIAV
jgi:hypothetical protein